ncbi:IS66-like element accessory protein TnpA [Consotaella aegiceratis]|uniref:IS66-like element accessory protein TnpA n=1 Tax=Consotaella aegiceratis TaxID=3097961 RepID=UPI002F426B9A
MDDARLEARNDGGDRRIEVITGDRRRRSWSDEEKDRILAESTGPGASVSDVARRNGVNRGVLTVWRRQVGLSKRRKGAEKAAPGSPMFVPITVDAGAAVNACATRNDKPRIEVEFDGGRIVIDGNIDPRLAAAVVTAARDRP